ARPQVRVRQRGRRNRGNLTEHGKDSVGRGVQHHARAAIRRLDKEEMQAWAVSGKEGSREELARGLSPQRASDGRKALQGRSKGRPQPVDSPRCEDGNGNPSQKAEWCLRMVAASQRRDGWWFGLLA